MNKAARKRTSIWMLIVLCLASIFFLFPVYWMLSLSVREATEFLTENPHLFPQSFTLEHYEEVIFNGGYLMYLKNSLVVALGTVVLCLILSSMAGYGLTRIKSRRGKVIRDGIFVLRMVPSLVYIVPMFMIFKRLGLTDTLHGLVLAYCSSSLPMAIYLFTGFYEEVPDSIYEAGLIDGCTEYQLFRQIALPMVSSSIAVVAILTFLNAWNEYVMALTLTFKNEAKTLPIAISLMFDNDKQTPFGKLGVVMVLCMIPAIVLSVTSQQYIVKGLTAGAVKG